jgi:RES domain-containing protein
MADFRPPRDHLLLDAIDALERVPFHRSLWRVVRSGRDPIQGHASGGRWDPGTFDVLYTACDPDGAIAETHFHLSRQPVFPSAVTFRLHELSARAERTLHLADMRALARLGVEEAHYPDLLYRRTQEIGDAAYFLGFDGIIAPSTRWSCLNAILFTDRIAADRIESVKATAIDWVKWRARTARKPRPD